MNSTHGIELSKPGIGWHMCELDGDGFSIAHWFTETPPAPTDPPPRERWEGAELIDLPVACGDRGWYSWRVWTHQEVPLADYVCELCREICE